MRPVLIGVEIVLAVYGTRLAIKQANDQDALMTKQMEVLNQLNANMQTTAKTLQTSQATMQSMNERLGMELGRLARVDLWFEFQLAAKTAGLLNRGNTDLKYWGYKLGTAPARMNKKPVSLNGGAEIALWRGLIDEIRNASPSVITFEVYVRDDFGTEFVGDISMSVGPNAGGLGTNLQIVTRQWSHK